MGERTLQIQLVGVATPTARRARRLGIGLLVSLPLGWPALSTALTDPPAFEASVARFVATVALSVASVFFIIGLHDRFTAGQDDDSADPALPATTTIQRGDQ